MWRIVFFLTVLLTGPISFISSFFSFLVSLILDIHVLLCYTGLGAVEILLVVRQGPDIHFCYLFVGWNILEQNLRWWFEDYFSKGCVDVGEL